MRPTRILLATALAFLLAGIGPSIAGAATDIERDEKKIKKYAAPVSDHLTRPRGYCVCHTDNSLGVIWFARSISGTRIEVYCATVTYSNLDGSRVASDGCASDWTPLAR
jgi:hypothetical protein